MLRVIYEDNHLLVCEKPVNMPVQADESGDIDLLTEAKNYIKEKYSKPGEVYLGLVHRLDRPVGGVMVFARTSKAAARLTDAFKTHRVKKRYAAVVSNTPPWYGALTDYIVKDETTRSSRIVSASVPGAKPARLEYALVTAKAGRSLLDILLHSGRHHQIRVQLMNSGFPIWGDQRYNPAARPGQSIALYAYSLTIEHPTRKETMTFTCCPSGKSWEGFADELSALCCGIRTVYANSNLIAVNKPAGLTCAAADGGEDTVEARLNCAFGEVYPVHRLDAMTTGLVLFARTKEARAVLNEAIRERRIEKTYHAEVLGRVNEGARLTLYAKKDALEARVRVNDKPFAGAAEMITEYAPIYSEAEKSLLRIKLITGRTHQIRASMAHISHPVIGDDKYGSRDANKRFGAKLRLCATDIAFKLPAGSPLEYLNGISLHADAPFEYIKEF